MRVRDHVVVSTAAAALLYPWAGRRVVGGWAASILIDADHYLWFCWRKRSLNPLSAVRFFNQAAPPHHRATRLFHSPGVLLLVLLLGARRRAALPVALGMGLHVAMDVQHEARMAGGRAAALRRDQFTCQECGAIDGSVGAHLWRQPRVFPSYRPQDFISLCARCHEAAHARGCRPGPRASGL
jgi:hypothetical protein